MSDTPIEQPEEQPRRKIKASTFYNILYGNYRNSMFYEEYYYTSESEKYVIVFNNIIVDGNLHIGGKKIQEEVHIKNSVLGDVSISNSKLEDLIFFNSTIENLYVNTDSDIKRLTLENTKTRVIEIKKSKTSLLHVNKSVTDKVLIKGANIESLKVESSSCDDWTFINSSSRDLMLEKSRVNQIEMLNYSLNQFEIYSSSTSKIRINKNRSEGASYQISKSNTGSITLWESDPAENFVIYMSIVGNVQLYNSTLKLFDTNDANAKNVVVWGLSILEWISIRSNTSLESLRIYDATVQKTEVIEKSKIRELVLGELKEDSEELTIDNSIIGKMFLGFNIPYKITVKGESNPTNKEI